MTMQVAYNDNTPDMISAYAADALIESKKIKMFYRPSEDRCITMGEDSVRKNTRVLSHYNGHERRLANAVAAQPV
jgi:hypothetical protein